MKEKYRLPIKLLLEMLKEVEIEGPCGKVKVLALIDTGATAQMITEDVYKTICLENESIGIIIPASGEPMVTKSGFVEMKVEGCPKKKVLTYVGPFNLIGMEYLSDSKAVIDTETGEMVCKVIKEKAKELSED
ncbi:MAG: hypothetical protein QXL06_01935 [Nitrososphaerota archaeon]